jgi:release factor glutamine methyltransferase
VRISEIISQTVRRLAGAGIQNPALDAELLLSHSLSSDRMRLHVEPDRELTEAEERTMGRLVRRRLKFEPIAYILGKKEFYSLEFMVNRNVLIPRPETELVVDLAVYYAPPGARVADIGTGSGAIAVSVKHSRSDLEVYAVDISKRALDVARKNAAAIVGKNKIRFLHGDLFGPLAGMSFHVIAANPPYVDRKQAGSLQRDLSHEPEAALFSDERGGEVAGRIVKEAGGYLASGGVLIMEIGDTMKDFVLETGGGCGFAVSVLNDHAGLPRVAVMRKGD